MNIKALITTLVLGSSSVALARPVGLPGGVPGPSVPGGVAVHDAHDARGEEAVIRDHRAQDTTPAEGSFRAPPFVPPWVTLGTADRIMDGSISFRVNPRLTNGFQTGFTTLRLQSTAGKTFVTRVEIKFANGGAQVVQLGKYLNASNPLITIDLAGDRRAIRSVAVVGRNARSSAFNVQAM